MILGDQQADPILKIIADADFMGLGEALVEVDLDPVHTSTFIVAFMTCSIRFNSSISS